MFSFLNFSGFLYIYMWMKTQPDKWINWDGVHLERVGEKESVRDESLFVTHTETIDGKFPHLLNCF